MSKVKDNIYNMDSSEFREIIKSDIFKSDIVVIEDGNLSLCVINLLNNYLGAITDHYLKHEEILLLKIRIHEIAKELSVILNHSDLFILWQEIDVLLDKWEKYAIHYELYEGVVNFKKLRDMV